MSISMTPLQALYDYDNPSLYLLQDVSFGTEGKTILQIPPDFP